MEHTVVGDMDISKLTLGTAQLGLNYGVANTNGKPDYQKSKEILKAAADHGVNCFDTAPLYGDSELIVGSFLSSCSYFAKPPVIVTKLPPMTLNGEATPNNAYDLVRQHVTRSTQRLGVSRIPIYLLHRASDIEAYGGLVTESLLRLKDEGLIGVLGVSAYTPEEVEQALGLEAIRAIQVPINVFDHRLIETGLLDRLKDKNFIVFARSIFLKGLFFLDARNLPPGLALAQDPLRQLEELSRDKEIGIAEVALTFVRDLPGITSLVIGAETPNQVLEDRDLMKTGSLSLGLREQIMSMFSGLPLELIDPRLWDLSG